MVDKPKPDCWVCEKENISDQHHIVPVEYDGPEDGRTVPLCPSCHRAVHREGENYAKIGVWGKFINDKLFPGGQLQRIKTLAEYIVQAKARFQASGKDKADDSRNIIQVSMSPDELKITHDLKKKLGFNSLARLVQYLIFEKWKEVNK